MTASEPFHLQRRHHSETISELRCGQAFLPAVSYCGVLRSSLIRTTIVLSLVFPRRFWRVPAAASRRVTTRIAKRFTFEAYRRRGYCLPSAETPRPSRERAAAKRRVRVNPAPYPHPPLSLTGRGVRVLAAFVLWPPWRLGGYLFFSVSWWFTLLVTDH